jgi:choline-sulfatase
MKKPNILLIMSDEHDPAVMGPYGNAIVQTPTLDRLAQQGVTFDNAYCNAPLCVPSRMSFCTGRYVSRIGTYDNHTTLPTHETTIAHMVRNAGYRPLLAGKMHFMGPDIFHGFDLLCKAEMKIPHPGSRWRRLDDQSVNVAERDRRFAMFGPWDDGGEPAKGMRHDLPITKSCTEFLRQRPSQEGEKEPFFLVAGYVSPHFPLAAPKRLVDLYKGRVPDPVIPEGHLESQPPHLQHLRRAFGVVETDPEQVRLGRECYYALVQWLDEEIAKVLQALEESGEADNTIIIYTSDHGEMLGEHGLWWKSNFYEQSSRVPLIISWPKRWGANQRRKGVCSLVDLSATILDMAGESVPEWFNGNSLVPLLEDPSAPWKDMAYCEHLAPNVPAPMVMLRRGRYKLNMYHGDGRELFDLEDDPSEFKNLAADPAYATLIQELEQEAIGMAGKSLEQIDAEVRFSQEVRGRRTRVHGELVCLENSHQ